MSLGADSLWKAALWVWVEVRKMAAKFKLTLLVKRRTGYIVRGNKTILSRVVLFVCGFKFSYINKN